MIRRLLIRFAILLLFFGGGWWWIESHLSEGWGLVLPSDGTVLGTFENVPVYAKNGPRKRGDYGLEFECVELINRFYVEKLGHQNMTKMGDADSYFWEPFSKGLVAYPNGGDKPPEKYDILIFDEGQDDGLVGHVALITEVNQTEGTVNFIQQNFTIQKDRFFKRFLWQDTLRLRHESSGKWWVDVRLPYAQPVAGWSRRRSSESRSIP